MKNLIRSIKEIVFDSRCPVCRQKQCDKNTYICYNCLEKLKLTSSLKSIENLYYIWEYRGAFKELILAYKGNGIRKISVIIGELIKEQLFHLIYQEEVDKIIAVPINKNRRNERGFNQVEEVLEYLNYSYSDILRVKNTKKMSKILDEKSREKNIHKSFKVKNEFNDKIILIVDDIITTGTTVNEIIKEIKKNSKPKKIIVFSFSITSTLKRKIIEKNYF